MNYCPLSRRQLVNTGDSCVGVGLKEFLLSVSLLLSTANGTSVVQLSVVVSLQIYNITNGAQEVKEKATS